MPTSRASPPDYFEYRRIIEEPTTLFARHTLPMSTRRRYKGDVRKGSQAPRTISTMRPRMQAPMPISISSSMRAAQRRRAVARHAGFSGLLRDDVLSIATSSIGAFSCARSIGEAGVWRYTQDAILSDDGRGGGESRSDHMKSASRRFEERISSRRGFASKSRCATSSRSDLFAGD